TLPRRFFTSVRWRSGLDADLQELRERLDRVAAALDPSREQAETIEAKLGAEAQRISPALKDPWASTDTARKERPRDPPQPLDDALSEATCGEGVCNDVRLDQPQAPPSGDEVLSDRGGGDRRR